VTRTALALLVIGLTAPVAAAQSTFDVNPSMLVAVVLDSNLLACKISGCSRALVLHAHAEDRERLDLPSSTKRALSRRMADLSSVAGRLVGLARGSCSSHLCGSSASVR
jgi:hypothetical protein